MRLRGALVALAVLLVGSVPAMAAPAPAPVPVLVVDGRGWGHGVGMAQDGALAMGRAGATTAQILGHFYPGTAIGKATGDVRVVVVPGPGQDTDITFPGGGEVRDARQGQQSPGFPVSVAPGGTVHLHYDGQQYSVQGGDPAPERAAARSAGPVDDALVGEPSSTTTSSTTPEPVTTVTTPPTTTTEPPTTTPVPTSSSTTTTSTTETTVPQPGPQTGSTTTTTQGQQRSTAAAVITTSLRPLWAVPSGANGVVAVPSRNRQYRGMVEAEASGADLRLVNELDVESYLRGMGEVRNPSWPPAALRTQAIAARTYAMRAMAASGEICDDDHCQVYLGAQAEYPAMDKVVADSAHQVLMFGKSLASTVYSANAGGFSATPEEGFGSPSPGAPYLKAAPYKSDDPMPWNVRVALTDVAARFGYRGQLKDVRVAAVGPSGRATSVVLDGDSGPVAVPGIQFASHLGLRSTLIGLHIDASAVPPPPPPPADSSLQAPPDQAAPTTATSEPPTTTEVALPAPAARPRLGVHRTATAPSPLGPAVIVGLLLVVYAGVSVPQFGGRPRGAHFKGQ